MKKNLHWLFGLLCLYSCSGPASVGEGGKPYQDLSHDSKVFGHKKFYRIYLPGDYDTSSRRYPVIYFFHGWGGRHFKDDNAKLEYPLLKPLVDKYGVILVMWDGNIDEAEPNPYNIGYHDDVKFQVQMKDYFPELVTHIDTTYRTLTGRDHRGIIGFSMGGFMSLFIAGKYPDSVCAAVSLAGSPEFFMGWPGNQTLYPIRYTFSNLQDQAVYIRNGNSDILYYLNEEVHAGADWEGKELNYETFAGGHVIDSPGQTRVFDRAMGWVADAFKKSRPAPERWSHYDLYPDFGVWGYQVHSDKKVPGTIFLKNAGKNGFGLFTRRWLPGGPAIGCGAGMDGDAGNRMMPGCGVAGGVGLHINVKTSPVYVPGKVYGTVMLAADSGGVVSGEAMSDAQGRINFDLDGYGSQVGIFNADSGPDFVIQSYSLMGRGESHPGRVAGRPAGTDGQSTGGYLHIGAHNRLALRIFNRGGEKGLPQRFRIVLSTADSSVKIADPVREAGVLAGRRILDLPPFDISCYKKPPSHAEPPDIKFRIAVSRVGKEGKQGAGTCRAGRVEVTCRAGRVTASCSGMISMCLYISRRPCSTACASMTGLRSAIRPGAKGIQMAWRMPEKGS